MAGRRFNKRFPIIENSLERRILGLNVSGTEVNGALRSGDISQNWEYRPESENLTPNGGTILGASDGGFWVRRPDRGTYARWFSTITANGVVDDRDALANIDAICVESNQPLILTSGTYRINTNLTLNSDVIIDPQAKIKIIGDTKLIFNGSFTAGDYQVFDFSESNFYWENIPNLGNIEFARGIQKFTKVSWFGAKNNQESARAIQRAIWATQQGEILIANGTFLISETILLRNSITITGTGHRTATQLTATEQFNDSENPNTVKLQGEPVMFCGYGQPSGVGEIEYQQWIGEWRKLNHMNFNNFQIVGLNKRGIGFMGSMYETTFFGVYVYSFDMAFWMHTSNTKFLGAGHVAMNRIGFKVGGGGGYIGCGTMIQNDIHFDIGWPYEVTGGLFGSVDLKIDQPYLEGHQNGVKFLVREGVINLTVDTPHMFGNPATAWSVHPCSQVVHIGHTSVVGLVDILPQSPITDRTHSLPDFGIKKGKPIQYVPDGDISTDYTSSNWTVANGELRKTMYRNQDNVQTMSFDNKIVMHVSTTHADNVVTTGDIENLGMLDFEYDTHLDREVRLTIEDSLDVVIFDSGWRRGNYSTRTMHTTPRKICGFVPESGTGPWKAKIRGKNDAGGGSSRSFQIRKLCIYKAKGLENFNEKTADADFQPIFPAQTYDGFEVFEFTANPEGYILNNLDGVNVLGGRAKLMGWIALVDEENKTSIKSRMNDAEAYNISHRRFLVSEDFEWFEQHQDFRFSGRVINHTSNPAKFAGAAWVLFYPEKADGIALDAIPTEGWWPRGAKVYFTNPEAGEHIGAVCVEAGSPGVWKNFGEIEALST